MFLFTTVSSFFITFNNVNVDLFFPFLLVSHVTVRLTSTKVRTHGCFYSKVFFFTIFTFKSVNVEWKRSHMIMEPWKAYLIWHAARNNSCRTHSLSIVGNIPKGLTECILDLPRIIIALSIAMGDSTNGDFTVSSHSFAGFCCMLLLCQRSLINYREGNYIEIAWCFLKLCIKLFHTLETFYLSSFFNNCFLI